MRFDVYGRFVLAVRRDAGLWRLYRLDDSKRRRFTDFVVPSDLERERIAQYLDDMLHEYAGPGDVVRRID